MLDLPEVFPVLPIEYNVFLPDFLSACVCWTSATPGQDKLTDKLIVSASRPRATVSAPSSPGCDFTRLSQTYMYSLTY